MNTANIKKYAPKARARFIDTMTRQAARVGISPDGKGGVVIAPLAQKGDVLVMTAQDGQTHTVPAHLKGAREALAAWVQRDGFTQAIEQAAYSWFNRLCAIRYMEIHGYLDHGRRVLSGAGGEAGQFQILEECLEVDLPGLDTARVRELKLDGTQDETLYRELLLAQCHALHDAMPFLFEPLDDASELLLPNNLTKTDSLIRELVEAIPEADWQDVEVIGWLYQFYISEKKDQVIGKVVKSEDIPAATQLFTPNWIVQYLVQNSVGRQWLQTYPASTLKAEMPYYIEPAEQEPEVQAQLDAITPASLDPETIKVLDPACGSGHILVEAYNVLKAIYEERGYRTRDIPKLILENNLFGLDIDDRAAQLAGFALLMKAREDDRRILTRNVRLNVLAMQSSQHLDANTLWRDLNLTGDWHQGQSQSLFDSEQQDLSSNDATYKLIADLIERFQDAKTFGSLIEVPSEWEAPLKALLEELTELSNSGDMMQKAAAQRLVHIVQQAWVLAQRYDAVVANPPYMGSKGMNKALKDYAKNAYPNSKSDLFACMKERSYELLVSNGLSAMIIMESWMFLSSYGAFRNRLLKEKTILDLVHMPYNGRGRTPLGINFGTSASISLNEYIPRLKGHFSCLRFYEIDQNGIPLQFPFDNERHTNIIIDDFKKIPGSPVAYWLSEGAIQAFSKSKKIKDVMPAAVGLQTGDNSKFVRYWYEVDFDKIGFEVDSADDTADLRFKWYPYNKGGDFRKWYGNQDFVVNWENNGEEIRNFKDGNGSLRSRPQNTKNYFKPSISWSDVTSGDVSFRYYDKGFIYDVTGMSAQSESKELMKKVLALCNSCVISWVVKSLNPTLHFQAGNYHSLPYIDAAVHGVSSDLVDQCINLSLKDGVAYETSFSFKYNPLLENSEQGAFLNYFEWRKECSQVAEKLRDLEILNNKYFLSKYSLEKEVEPEVSYNKISLNGNPHYRYGGNRSEEELETLLQCDTLKELVSYAIGCMMGRYSLDKPGLILASQGEAVRDYLAHIPEPSFAPDDNAIIPLTDQEWFPDDATNRFRNFVRTAWGDEHLQENLDFVAESLCLHAIKPKKGEAALETIRRYLSTQFFKDHLRTYKKRPIYWLFSSGKQKAFECLVYLHRYNESTLAEMRTDYVIPLTTKLASYVEKLEQDKDASTSAAEAKAIEKELSKLYKQQTELNTFDEKLRHYADQRISLDLDDGVKVNYGKFGDLLAEVKQVVGKSRSE
ncbi:BREX-1 system adenine-specific DNA-methyltransferase PglX [Halomonas sp. R1t8]|jgi:type II restriction/modification system DNA methylase subunit YeeA|uniref:BREX-1 system adenine-specific DNA-methyltransferase PglX n=1 Tax=unclassified Halomonas TaxID=2609666 RepID=UPI00209EDA2C|nr:MULTISPECIES: BREX-1 system adenine-specific DNA-methyltransferase PglX [unclassified Halomonas]MCP1304244.1 BREX-1 system adenine-specific DNA-methyltransferase PglX [Halomonas sp. R1t8]MCP1330375.1 BREX-1 system adenine-specific DNA-methyltransferase PglX [Halomonas sp. R1t4]